jgi:hypothetical protein
VPSTGPVLCACDGDARNELVATFFRTEPPTLVAERGDRSALMVLQPSASGGKPEPPGRQGAGRVDFELDLGQKESLPWPQALRPSFLPLLLAATACAHVAPGEVSRGSERVPVEGTVVEVRQAEEDGAVADQVRRVLPRAVQAATRWGTLPATVTLTIHSTHAQLEAATGRAGNPWMRAWARARAVDLQSPRSWSRGHASDEALTKILAHELTHCVLFQVAGGDGRAREIPIWFLEGMASVAAGERHAIASPDAVTSPEPMLRSAPKLVYGTADRAFRDLVMRHGEPRVRALLRRLGEGQPFSVAFRDAVGVTLAEFEGDLARRLSAVAVNG